ncbi:MAG: undecaprenyl-diphosphate phosphatase [Propionibacteriaceae bacterium]|nr:undecaprenyl-diphosphate phosphatase [Propionibacteriaceae bacterium]
MDWIEAIVLGIVQGLTEFLPISSSAHISIVGQLFFGGADPGAAFTAITQLGTETAVILYFLKDIGHIIAAWWHSVINLVKRNKEPLTPDARMGWLVIIGSMPIIILGLLFEDAIDTSLRNLWVTVGMLAGFALIIWLCDIHAKNRLTLKELTWLDGIAYGCAQALALIPGVSRSGATISAGLFMGYKREDATRYAFLLAIPAVFGSGLYKLKDIADDPRLAIAPTLVATVLAFGVGLAVIHWVLGYVSKHDFKIFVFYRLGLAAVIGSLLATGVMQP